MHSNEYNSELYLFSAVSPEWIRKEKSIEIKKEPANFGSVSASMRLANDALTVVLSNQFHGAPAKIVIRVPWFFEVTGAEVDGHPVAVHRTGITVAANARTIRLRGRVRSGEGAMSYEDAIRDYKAAYARHYSKFLQTGDVTP